MHISISMLIALLGGLLPSFIWLFFWLKQDARHPEPNSLIIWTFTLGMLSVPFAYIAQVLISKLLIGGSQVSEIFINNYVLGIVTIVILASIEEVLKYVAAYYGGLSKAENDEPIDPIVYMVTAALGFSALETSLFLLNQIHNGETFLALIVGNVRFMGASLLHVAASGLIGIFIGFSYYKNQYYRQRYLLAGFIVAITLHAAFNSFIISKGNLSIIGHVIVWVSIIIMISLFERIRLRVKKKDDSVGQKR